MKLVKLSLAALIAAGALSSVASAKPLDEAIKNVDINGFLRVRYTNDHQKDGETADTKYNFRAVLDSKITIDDNFFAVLGLDYSANDIANNKDGNTETRVDKGAANLAIDNFYLGYSVGNTTVLAGRQAVGAFWTDDMLGTGLKVLNSDIPGLTLAALWMDSLEADGDIGTKKLVNPKDKKHVMDHDLYGVAAMGSFDPVSFQLWYAKLEDVTDLLGGQFNLDFAVNDDVKFGFVGQASFTKFDNKFFKGTVDDGLFWATELNTELYGFDAAVGYVNYSTDKGKNSLASFEDKGQLLAAGEQIGDNYSLYTGDNAYIYGVAGYTINGLVRIGVDYAQGKFEDKSLKVKEIVPRVKYKYDDSLTFSSYYSMAELKEDGEKTKNNEFRLEAKYSF